MHRRAIFLIAICSLFTLVVIAQSKDAKKDSKKGQVEIPKIPVGTVPADAKIAEYVNKNFGPEFSLVDGYPVLTGDLDVDGTEDAIIVVTRKDNPMLDEEEFNYKVIDPYDKYFGFGDPSVTANFHEHDPRAAKYLAIIHDWRAEQPKLKVVVINLPFEKLSIKRIVLNKKKKLTGISAEEMGGSASAIYWDGKQYRWSSLSGMD